MIARMRIRKGTEYAGLSVKWGKSPSSIGYYCRKWIPNWGFAGQDLSILDITVDYLKQKMPKEFINNQLGDVCGMVDGKRLFG